MNLISLSQRAIHSCQSFKALGRWTVASCLSFGLFTSLAPASRPTTAWSTTTGDFFDATLWNSGLPDTSHDAIIDNGGTATITTANPSSNIYVYLGSQQNTSGHLEISAGGEAKFTTLVVGALNATGTLKITGGGKLTTFGGPIGSDYLGVGRATVAGTGSSWKVEGSEMVVGGNGNGSLTLTTGGNFNVGAGSGRIQLANHPTAEGNLIFGDGGLSGTITASEIYNGEGRGTIIFNHTNTAFNFATKLTGIKTLNGYLNVVQKGPGTTVMSGTSELAGSTREETYKVTENGTEVEKTRTVIVPAVTVEAGTLVVTGSIVGSLADIIVDDMIIGQEKSTGEVLVKATGTLKGTGFIEGKTTIEGTLAPGVTIGILKFGDDLKLTDTGTVTIELGGRVRGTGYDGVDMTGTLGELFYAGTLRIVLANGFVPTAGDTFDIFKGFTSSTGAFASVLFSSNTYSALFDPASGDVSIVAVPEPTVFGLAAGGLVALGLARRNRASRRIES